MQVGAQTEPENQRSQDDQARSIEKSVEAANYHEAGHRRNDGCARHDVRSPGCCSQNGDPDHQPCQHAEKPLFKAISENQFLVDAKIDLDILNDELDIDLPVDKSYESLGGFIFDLIGSVPDKKQEIAFGSYKFIIEKVDRNRILEVLLIKPTQQEDASLEF